MKTERVEVAVVGGGPAGAVVASLLARAGHEVVILERSTTWRWRACGVFASPAAMTTLRGLGLDGIRLEGLARPVSAMRVETPKGVTFDLTYGADAGGDPAVGFDRSALDPMLLEWAAQAGADVRRGWRVVGVEPAAGRLDVRSARGGSDTSSGPVEPGPTEARALRADVVVGADGIRSIVARAAGVDRRPRLRPRIGLTYHLAERDGEPVRVARMLLIRDGYVGIAPVPGDRSNVGIVLGRSWSADLRRHGARSVVDSIVAGIRASAQDPPAVGGDPIDTIAGAWPIGHRVSTRAGGRWLLVGDAAGFVDPFTGEGIHRALVSAEIAAAAIHAPTSRRATALARYDRHMSRRFITKDVVSSLVLAFLARPTMFEYAARRIAARAEVRSTIGLVMGDLVGAGTALDPRYLAALLAP
jgi:flavin-dependent dehydrogenase